MGDQYNVCQKLDCVVCYLVTKVNISMISQSYIHTSVM